MAKKSKYNPSGKPVLTKMIGAKGPFVKSLENNRKRLIGNKKVKG